MVFDLTRHHKFACAFLTGEGIEVGLVHFPQGKGHPWPPDLKHAQPVLLDDRQRLIYSTVGMRPPRSWEAPTTTVIMRAAGVKMEKASGVFRSQLPPELSTIMKMWTHCLSGGYTWIEGLRCSICKKHDHSTRVCPLCCQSYHAECCISLLSHSINSMLDAPAKPLHGWPDLFRSPGMLCQMCSHFYSA